MALFPLAMELNGDSCLIYSALAAMMKGPRNLQGGNRGLLGQNCCEFGGFDGTKGSPQ